MYSEQIFESSKFREVIIKQRKKERTRSEGREKTLNKKKGASTHELCTAKRKQRRAKSVNETTSGEKQQKKRQVRRAARSAQFRDSSTDDYMRAARSAIRIRGSRPCGYGQLFFLQTIFFDFFKFADKRPTFFFIKDRLFLIKGHLFFFVVADIGSTF